MQPARDVTGEQGPRGSAMRLGAPLRLEAKQEDATAAIADFEGGGFATEQFRVENIAACKFVYSSMLHQR